MRVTPASKMVTKTASKACPEMTPDRAATAASRKATAGARASARREHRAARGERVSEVALFQRVLQLYGLDGGRKENRIDWHVSQVAATRRRAKMRMLDREQVR
jgi:hypothetical protein